MGNATCTIDGCDRPIKARGWCGRHYGRAYRRGERANAERPKITDVDREAMTCTCPIHGTGSKLRIRQRAHRSTASCRLCDRGPRPLRAYKRSRSGTGFSASSRVYSTYGVSEEEVQLRIEAQQGLCLICSEPLRKPMIDHDHASGRVRGILCLHCNAGLGFFRDNASALSKAAKYVRRYAG